MRLTHSTLLLLTLTAALTAQEAGKAPRPQRQARVDPMSAAWQQALAAARQHKTPLLVFVLPDEGPVEAGLAAAQRQAELAIGMLDGRRVNTDEPPEPPPIATRRELLLRQVQLLRAMVAAGAGDFAPHTKATDLQRLFALTHQAMAPAAVCSAKAGETAVLLRTDGQRLAGYTIGLGDAEAFLRAVRGDVLTDKLLAPRIANVDPELRRAVRRLRDLWERGERETPEFVSLHTRVLDNAPAAAPALFGEADAELPRILMQQALKSTPPFGTREQSLPEFSNECSLCGMGYVPPQLSSVLKLLGP
jgi:hypothetical protein